MMTTKTKKVFTRAYIVRRRWGATNFIIYEPVNLPIQNAPIPPIAKIKDAACSLFLGMKISPK